MWRHGDAAHRPTRRRSRRLRVAAAPVAAWRCSAPPGGVGCGDRFAAPYPTRRRSCVAMRPQWPRLRARELLHSIALVADVHVAVAVDTEIDRGVELAVADPQ